MITVLVSVPDFACWLFCRLFARVLHFFKIIFFSKNSFMIAIVVKIGLDPDEGRCFVARALSEPNVFVKMISRRQKSSLAG